MRLHMLGIFHTVCDETFSHCAFTNKTRLFSPMLRAQGFEVTYYGVAGMQSGATEDVVLMEQDEHLALLGQKSYHEDPTAFVGNKAVVGTSVATQFNYRLRDELDNRLEPGDVVCLPFGHAHENAIARLELLRTGECAVVETGIGYPSPCTIRRVYESQAWRHWTMGKEGFDGYGWETPRQEWVIPNYYQIEEWPVHHALSVEGKRTVVFLGRLNESKGCAIIPRLARAFPHLRFVLCGQGDPTPYLGEPNVEYLPPLQGGARAPFLGDAAVALFPSRMIEPFCGAAVEAMLCGTPVLTSDYGAFTETNLNGVTGYRCTDEHDFIRNVEWAMLLKREAVAASARARFSTTTCGPMYAKVFADVARTLQRPLVVA